MEEELKETIYQTSHGYVVKLRYPAKKQASDKGTVEATKDIMRELVFQQMKKKGEL